MMISKKHFVRLKFLGQGLDWLLAARLRLIGELKCIVTRLSAMQYYGGISDLTPLCVHHVISEWPSNANTMEIETSITMLSIQLKPQNDACTVSAFPS